MDSEVPCMSGISVGFSYYDLMIGKYMYNKSGIDLYWKYINTAVAEYR